MRFNRKDIDHLDNQAYSKHTYYHLIHLARPTSIRLEIKMKVAVNVNFFKKEARFEGLKFAWFQKWQKFVIYFTNFISHCESVNTSK